MGFSAAPPPPAPEPNVLVDGGSFYTVHTQTIDAGNFSTDHSKNLRLDLGSFT